MAGCEGDAGVASATQAPLFGVTTWNEFHVYPHGVANATGKLAGLAIDAWNDQVKVAHWGKG